MSKKSLPTEFTSVVGSYGIVNPADGKRSTRAQAQERVIKMIGKELGPFGVALYRINDAWLQGSEELGLIFIRAKLIDRQKYQHEKYLEKKQRRARVDQRAIDTSVVHRPGVVVPIPVAYREEIL